MFNFYMQNYMVCKVMVQLKDIGYLDYIEFKCGWVIYFSVYYCNLKFISSKVVVFCELEEEVFEQNYDEVIKVLKVVGIDFQKLVKVFVSVKLGND